MAEQKKANEALNVEEALSQSEAFLIKNKKAIIGAVVADTHICFCQVGSFGSAVFISNLSETCESDTVAIQGLFVKVGLKVFLSFEQCSTK